MWFKGSINEAINKSKTEKKLFVVYVNGSDEISHKMDALFNELSGKLSELSIVAIKLESQSENCKLFSQIYPVILIPSTYFIDLNGVAIEIIGGSLEDQNVLFEKINKTIDIFNKSLDTISHPKNDIENSQMSTTATTSGVQPVAPNSWEPIPENSLETIDEKVERANRLIEAIRLKKAKEEEETQRLAEIERIKAMKAMQESKRIREDKEAIDIIKEREREKKEEKLAKERVLAQIAADREERKRRQQMAAQNPEPIASTSNTSGNKTEQTEVRHRSHDKTRIQFRLPDGSKANNIFDAKDSLESIRQYVSSNFNIRSFLLSTTFPRKEFSSEDYPKTLEELSLCPSSVLLVILKSGSNTSGAVVSNSIFWQIFSLISIPFVMIWNFMATLFNRTDETTVRPNQRPEQQRTQNTFYSKEGNIARIKKEEDDDDNNTWNGNSTQQM